MSNDNPLVELHNPHEYPLGVTDAALAEVFHQIAAGENVAIELVNVVLLDDEELLRMNQRYLQHDTYTDIITFDLSEEFGPLQGELYISFPRIEENAQEFGVTPQEEFLRVAIHGVLHLSGYVDATPAEKEIMRGKEDRYLRVSRGTTTD